MGGYWGPAGVGVSLVYFWGFSACARVSAGRVKSLFRGICVLCVSRVVLGGVGGWWGWVGLGGWGWGVLGFF